MKIAGSHTVPVERQRLWDALHDPDLLRRCLPGCSVLLGHEAGRYTATVHVGIPCVEGLYHADLVVEEREAPTSLTLAGSLLGEPGSGRGRARLDLEGEGDQTTIRYDLDAEVVGAVSRVGRRLLESAIRRTIAQHLDAVAAEITGTKSLSEEEGTVAPVPSDEDPAQRLAPVPSEADLARQQAATVTFAPARLGRDRVVTIAIAAVAASAAYLLGRRSSR